MQSYPQHNSYVVDGRQKVPRCAAEEQELLFGETSKYRQLPCKTFILAGTCPYRDRCDYLHDPRCLAKDAKGKTRKSNREDTVMDTFYWPNLSVQYLRRPHDRTKPPIVVQPYHVPEPKKDKYYRHDAAIYSLWNYFAEFCLQTYEGKTESPTAMNIEILSRNRFTGRLRLRVFIELAHGDILKGKAIEDASTAGNSGDNNSQPIKSNVYMTFDSGYRYSSKV